MANLKQAFEYAAQNPNSDFAKNLAELAKSGSLNQEAQKYGIDLSPFQQQEKKQEEPLLTRIGKGIISSERKFGEDIAGALTNFLPESVTGVGALKEAGQAKQQTIDLALKGLKQAKDTGKDTKKYLDILSQASGTPITTVEDIYPALKKTGMQVAGDAAGVLLDIVTAGSLPGTSKGLATEATKGFVPLVKEVAKGTAIGAGTGYGYDVTQNLQEGQTGLEAATPGVATVVGATLGGGIPLAGATKALATELATKAKPVIAGTKEVVKSTARTLGQIPENIATNVGEMQAKEAVINSFPSTAGQNAIRKGIDIADATTLQNAIKTPEAKTLIETIKNYAAGNRSVSPFEVVGKPIVNRLKTLDTQVKKYASELDTVAQDLKNVSLADVSKIDTAVMEGLNKLQIGVKKEGLDFVGSSLEGIGSSGKIVDNVFKRLQEARDAFDLHNLKKYIDANVSYGKRVEGLDAGAERLLKTWRKAIDDTLDTQFIEYNKVNTELAKRISPLEDLKSILKNTDGLDTDLLSEKAGIIARRITSAAASNPEIKQVLRNLDQFTSTTGKTLGKIENLQDLYNILNKYYDIAPKTGFQNLVKEGVNVGGGLTEQVIDKVKGFAGSTNATRQKALENYLDELLNPAKAKIPTKVMNSTKATTKNVIMQDTIPQSTKAASKVVEKSIPKELQPLAEEAKNIEPITSVNPTGGVLVDYTPQARMTAPLGENMTTLANTMKKNPDTLITVYRGAPKTQKAINPGDFISTDRNSALSYAEDGNVISKKVKLGDILDDMDEPLGGDYLYRPGAFSEIGNRVRDISKSEWYKNYLAYLKDNPTKFKNVDEWLNAMKASNKPKQQLIDLWNKANGKN
jgi:hypothetical protein